MQRDDRELVEGIRRGDHRAFEELYLRHRQRLYRHALVQTGGRAAVAEEVVQDVFLALVEGSASPQGNVAGYLLVSVRNRAVNACQRREARQDSVSLEAVQGLLVRCSSSSDPTGEANRREEGELLSRALLHLSAEHREVVLLRTFEGLAWKEIAALTGVPVPTASTRYRAALNQLRTACRSLSHA